MWLFEAMAYIIMSYICPEMIKLLSVTCLQSQPDAAHGEGGEGPPSTEG